MKSKLFFLLTGVVLLSVLSVLLAQEFRITEVALDPGGPTRLQHVANTNSYYILYRGEDVGSIVLATDLALGTNSFGELVDPTNVLARGSSFYRVREVPLDQPLDTDTDGIDDVYELKRRVFLDPLNRFDASLDFDHDGRSNLREYQESTDPTVVDPNAAALIETSPMPGETEVNVVRETIIRFSGPVNPATVTTNSFYLLANGVRVPGLVLVSSTERFATFFYDDPLPSATEITATVIGDSIMDRNGFALDADHDVNPGGTKTFKFRTLPLSRIPGTVVFGYVRNSYTGDPVQGATVRVDAFPEANAVTDANGRFELMDMPAPVFFVHVDGTTAVNVPPGFAYPNVGKAFHSVPGQTSQINHHGHVFDVYLPLMALGDIQNLSGSQVTDVGFGVGGIQTLTNLFPELDPSLFDLLSVRFEPGAAYNQDTMAIANQAAVIPVPPDRLPSPLPPGVNPRLVISIQALGATSFDTPAQVTFPNLDGFPPGSKATLWSFDHDSGHFIPIGNMTVSADGLTITTDPGVGVLAPGWHFVSDPRNWSGDDGEPEDKGTNTMSHVVQVRFVAPGSSERISFSFNPPAGTPAQAGNHSPSDIRRQVKIEVTGPFFDFFRSDGPKALKARHAFTLQPGDSPVQFEAFARSLEEIEQEFRDGRRFTRDRLYGARINIYDSTSFPDGTSDTKETDVFPFAYLDVSDDISDDALRFPDLLLGRTQMRAFDVARGVPAFDLIIEGTDAGAFSTTAGALSFNPSGTPGEKSADLRVRVNRDGPHLSLNSLTLQGKAMTPQRLALNKALLEATLAELVTTNDRYHLSYAGQAGTFSFSFLNGSSTTLSNGASANDVFAALANFLPGGVSSVLVSDTQDDGGEPAIYIELTGFLDEVPVPLELNGPGATLTALVLDSRLSLEERNLINTPAKRELIANRVEARVLDRLGDLTDGLTVVDLPGGQDQTIAIEYALGGRTPHDPFGLFGIANSGIPDANDNVGFKAVMDQRNTLRTNQLLFATDQALNTFLSGSAIVYPDRFFESGLAGDLAANTNDPTLLLVSAITKTILHEGGHTLGAVHVFKPPGTNQNVVINLPLAGSPSIFGSNDILRSGFDAAVTNLVLQSLMSRDLLKLALNLDYTQAEAGSTFDYLSDNLAKGNGDGLGFDADGTDPNATPVYDGTLLLLRHTQGKLVLGEMDVGNVLADGPGGNQAVVPLQLHSAGSQPVTIQSVVLDPPTYGFSITPVAPGTVLSHGQSLPFNIGFDPLAGNEAHALLRVMSTDSNAPLQKFLLSGFGVATHAVFDLSLEDDNNNFGGVELGSSVTKLITIQNLGASNLTFTLLAASRSIDFDLGGFENAPQLLAFGESLEIPITFTPTRLGLARQLFSFVSNDPDQPTVNASVMGTGVRPGGALAADAVWGGDYVAIEQGSLVERLRSNPQGHFMTALPTFSPYSISVFDAASGTIATGSGVSGPAAAFHGLTGGLTWEASTAQDTDGDGLPDDIELAIGTSVGNRDTDGDGMDDFTEILQGLNPADGVGAPVGILGSLDLPGAGRDLEIATFVDAQGGQQDLAFVALSGGFQGLFVADISNPGFPIALGLLSVPSAGTALDVEVDVAARLAVFASGSGIYSITVSNPASPAIIASAPTTPATSLELVEGVVYANSTAGIRVLDAVTLDELDIIPVAASQLDYDNGFLYAAGGGQLRVIDVHNPVSPMLRGSVSLGGSSPLDLYVGGSQAVVGTASGLRICGVSDPDNPLRLDDEDPFPDNFGVTLNGSGLALSARDNFGVTVFDISSPANVASVRAINTGGPLDVRLHEGIAVTAGFRMLGGFNVGALTTINYLGFDAAGQPPVVSLTASVTDVAPGTPGLQVYEGTPIPLQITASDDVQVRRVELLVNGIVTEVDTAFPFNFTTIVPPIVGEARTLSLQAKASDMGLNEAATAPLVIDILSDTVPPTLVESSPAEGASVFAPGALILTFNEILDAASLDLGAVSLAELGPDEMPGGGDDTGIALASIAPRGLGQRIAVTPTTLLLPGKYRLAIAPAGLRDLVGNALAAPIVLNFTVRPPLNIVAASGTPADPNAPSLNVGQPLIVQTTVDPRLIHVVWPTLDANGNPGVLTVGAQESEVNDTNGTASLPAPLLAATGPITIFGSAATNVTKLAKWDVNSGAALIRGEDSQGGQTDDQFPGNGLYVHWRSLQAGHTIFAMQTRDLISLQPGDYELRFSAHGFGDFANTTRFTVSLGTAFSEQIQFNGSSTALSNITRIISVVSPEQVRIVVEESGGGAFNAGTVDNFRLTRVSDSEVLFEDDFELDFMEDNFLLQIVPTLTGGDTTSLTSDFPGGNHQLMGSGFTEGAFSVHFGDAVLTDMNLVGSPDVTGNNSQIALTVPTNAAFGPITVTTAGGTSAPLPVRLDEIVSVATRGTPANPAVASANIGQEVLLRGQGFTLLSDFFLLRVDISGNLTRRRVSPQTVNSNGTEAVIVLPDDTLTGPVNIPGNPSEASLTLQLVPTIDVATTEGSVGRVYLLGSGFAEGMGTYKLGPAPEQTVVDADSSTAPADVISVGGPNRAVRLPNAPAFAFGQVSASGPGGTSEAVDLKMLNPALQRALYDVAVDPASGDIFVAAGGANSFIRRLSRTGATVAEFDIPNANVVDAVGLDVLTEGLAIGGTAVAAGALLVFNGESNPNEIVALHATNGSELAKVQLPSNPGVRGGVYDPTTDHFFVTYTGSPEEIIAEINPADGSVIRTFTIATTFTLGGLAIDPGTGHFWVASSQRRLELVSRVDGSLQQTLDVSAQVLGNVLTGLALDVDGKILATSTHGVVYQLDP